MATIHIDEATEADGPELVRLERASPEGGRIEIAVDSGPDYFAVSRYHSPTLTLVARTAAGAIVGATSYWVYEAELAGGPGRAAYHSRLRVHPGFRRQGIGTALLAEACARAEADGAEVCWGAVAEANAASLRTCAAAGYAPVRTLHARIVPTGWLVPIPSARFWARRIRAAAALAAGLELDEFQLQPLAAAEPARWLALSGRRGEILAAARLGEALPWRVSVRKSPALVLLATRMLARVGVIPHLDLGVRFASLSYLNAESGREREAAGLIFALGATFYDEADFVLVVVEPGTLGARAAARIPAYTARLTAFARPSARIDSRRPIGGLL